MAQPLLKSFAQRIYDDVAPLAWADSQYQWALAYYCGALGAMFQLVDDYGRDQVVNGKIAPGWSQLLDINRAPTEALPWLAQFVGATLPVSASDAAMRAQLLSVPGWRRGTPAAMVAAAQATLTGNKTVTMIERAGDAYTVVVITKASETPDVEETYAALLSQKPGGIILVYENIDGQTYGELLSINAPTYALAYTSYSDYQHLLLNNNNSTPTSGGNVTFGGGTFGAGTMGG